MRAGKRVGLASLLAAAVIGGACSSSKSGGGTTPTYAISGVVSGAVADGVTVTLGGASSATTTTSGGGHYSFTGLADGGTYTVTPSLAGYTFSPVSASVTLSGADVVRSFTSVTAAVTYTISGAVSGDVADGVLVTLSGASSGTVTTSGGGLYAFSGLLPGSYTVTPSRAGYTFSPASLSPTITNASLASQNFAATAITYAISGQVTGAGVTAVTVSLSGDATQSTTTDGTGHYTFSVHAGSYTVTPTKAGYSFTPASRSVPVTSADATGQDFAAAVSATYTLSGTVTGPVVQGVTVTLGGASSATTTTDAGGAYGFTGLQNETYSVTPSLAGYTFTPPTASVAMNGANRTQDFAAASTITGFSISGTVTYGGAKTGRIYLVATSADGSRGTSLATPGTFTIRGVLPGSYTIMARLDAMGHGVDNAGDPTGMTSGVLVTSGNASGVTVALADPPSPTPTVPAGLMAFPGDQSMLVVWDSAGAPATETATSYDLSWGRDAAATDLGVLADIAARDDAHYVQTGLTNGDVLYYRIRSKVGASASAWSGVAGPFTVGAAAGGHTVSGTVTFPGTATGPLYVAVQDQTKTTMRVAGYATPGSSPASFSVPGVADGVHGIYVILDQNADHVIGEGDLSNTGDLGATVVTVSGADVSGVAVALNGAKGVARTTTEQVATGVGSTFYMVDNRVMACVRRPVAVTVLSGKGLPLPLDVAKQWGFDVWMYLGATAPSVGDTYRFSVLYDDGTSEILAATVTGVLGTFATGLTETTGAPHSAGVPLFSWTAPSPAPSGSYGYWVSLGGNGQSWYYPNAGIPMPSTTTSVEYNADGGASSATLPSGMYTWSVTVEDANGNRATRQKSYTVP
jgi:hypothetical protein